MKSPLAITSAMTGVIEHRGILGRAVDNLGIRIVGGEWAENDNITRESDLMTELGVSRSVIRESFRILGAKGLIRSRTSDGTRVLPRSEWRLLDPDLMDWRIRSGDNKKLLQDLMQVRLVLEPGVAFMATRMAGPEDRRRVMEAWEAKVETARNEAIPEDERRRAFILTDLDFHRALLATVGSELLEQLFTVIEAALGLLIDLQMRAKGYTRKMIGMDESNVLHESVYRAFMAREPQSAEDAMRELILRAIEDAQQGFSMLQKSGE